ncbi:MAG TPA: nucleotidyltransferase family protein [Ottowia sp.]|uniref:nucleotidyltransferase family protein n=1 Tax=Ottowia sp. TaxID=1898956 RepID=UPI002CAFBEEA|nr:nucleotidyltransferase family protein [Ottowia sp.]HMN22256.1 nucleotidyltransferase family protein [Ottowia sp.]
MTALRALILAAGRGERMRPLTDATPKPLLMVRDKPLLQWWLEALQHSGCSEVVINTAWLGEQVEHWATRWQAGHAATPRLRFSPEGRDFGHALETAGGIARALPWLAPQGGDAFMVVAGDIFAPGFRLAPDTVARFTAGGKLAHLWLVPNPPHKPQGDFGLDADGLLANLPELDPVAAPAGTAHTFAAIGLYRRSLFELPWCDIPPGNRLGVAARLAPLLRKAAAVGLVSAELYEGPWADVGTPERLARLNAGGTAADTTAA